MSDLDDRYRPTVDLARNARHVTLTDTAEG